jgi:hypothetical protein
LLGVSRANGFCLRGYAAQSAKYQAACLQGPCHREIFLKPRELLAFCLRDLERKDKLWAQ